MGVLNPLFMHSGFIVNSPCITRLKQPEQGGTGEGSLDGGG